MKEDGGEETSADDLADFIDVRMTSSLYIYKHVYKYFRGQRLANDGS